MCWLQQCPTAAFRLQSSQQGMSFSQILIRCDKKNKTRNYRMRWDNGSEPVGREFGLPLLTPAATGPGLAGRRLGQGSSFLVCYFGLACCVCSPTSVGPCQVEAAVPLFVWMTSQQDLLLSYHTPHWGDRTKLYQLRYPIFRCQGSRFFSTSRSSRTLATQRTPLYYKCILNNLTIPKAKHQGGDQFITFRKTKSRALRNATVLRECFAREEMP